MVTYFKHRVTFIVCSCGIVSLLLVQLTKIPKTSICAPTLPCSAVPWVEPDTRRKYPGGGGNRRLPGHLHLCALQRPGYHGHVPPSHIGAKGRFVVFYPFRME